MGSLGRGGAERALVDIIVNSDPTRIRHIVCHLWGPDDLAAPLRAIGCETICLDAAPSAPAWAGAAFRLRRLIGDRRPELVQSATFEANIVARLATFGLGLPLLTWIVGMDYDPASVRAAGWPRTTNEARRLLDAVTARAAGSRFVACATAVRESAIARLGLRPERVDMIYNPVDLRTLEASNESAAAIRQRLGLDPESFTWLIVGRLDPAKGHDILLRAFHDVVGRGGDAQLVIVGKGPSEERLRGLAAELGLDRRVRFTGAVPSIAPYFASADGFVFPSLLEGLPVALLEAMCAGVPAIASDIPPHEEVVRDGETGLLVRSGSATQLADAMERLARSPALRRDLAKAASDWAIPTFSADRIALQWQALYEHCLSS